MEVAGECLQWGEATGSGAIVDVTSSSRESLARLGDVSCPRDERIHRIGLGDGGEHVWWRLLLLPYPAVVERKIKAAHHPVASGDGQTVGVSLRRCFS